MDYTNQLNDIKNDTYNIYMEQMEIVLQLEQLNSRTEAIKDYIELNVYESGEQGYFYSNKLIEEVRNTNILITIAIMLIAIYLFIVRCFK